MVLKLHLVLTVNQYSIGYAKQIAAPYSNEKFVNMQNNAGANLVCQKSPSTGKLINLAADVLLHIQSLATDK